MKVTFLEDHISELSGHSFYKAGTQADLVHGQQLVKKGIAFAGWGHPPVEDVAVEKATVKKQPKRRKIKIEYR